MISAVVFDLDDTLYPELSYVYSGFRAVASFLSDDHFSQDYLYGRMTSLLEIHGRGKVFDMILQECGRYSNVLVKTLLFIYRNHTPQLTLPTLSEDILTSLRSKEKKLGIITDGNMSTQHHKVEALGLYNKVDQVIGTDIFGPGFSKPSLYPYQVMSTLLGVDPTNMMYVGDNITKDFLGANQLGIHTVYLNPTKQPSILDRFYWAKDEILSLSEILNKVD